MSFPIVLLFNILHVRWARARSNIVHDVAEVGALAKPPARRPPQPGRRLGKCIPHALALTVKKALLNLPCSKDIVVYGSSILHAGGTTQRAAALDLLGAQAQYLSTRFCSAVVPAEYRLENWEVLADFYTSSETLPLRTGIGRRDERADLRRGRRRAAARS
jgi:hypothetical protein